MRKILAALSALVVLSAPACAADFVSGVAPANGKPPSPTAIGTWNGSAGYIWPSDTDGIPYVRNTVPNMMIINHRSNVTLASAAYDSSAIPFQTIAYRQLYGLVRMKAVSYNASAAVEFAIRAASSATADSTALGWWYPLGLGNRYGKTLYFPSPVDAGVTRWRMIPLNDSLMSVPFQAPYASVFITNRTGAQIIYDFWLLGVPW